MFNREKKVTPLPSLTHQEYDDLLSLCNLWWNEENKKLSGQINTHESVFKRIATFNLYNTSKSAFGQAFTNDSYTNTFGRFLQLFLSVKVRFGSRRIQAMINDLVTEIDGNKKYATVHEDYTSFKELMENHQFLVLVPILSTIELNH